MSSGTISRRVRLAPGSADCSIPSTALRLSSALMSAKAPRYIVSFTPLKTMRVSASCQSPSTRLSVSIETMFPSAGSAADSISPSPSGVATMKLFSQRYSGSSREELSLVGSMRMYLSAPVTSVSSGRAATMAWLKASCGTSGSLRSPACMITGYASMPAMRSITTSSAALSRQTPYLFRYVSETSCGS